MAGHASARFAIFISASQWKIIAAVTNWKYGNIHSADLNFNKLQNLSVVCSNRMVNGD
jgi:hypothetical protein